MPAGVQGMDLIGSLPSKRPLLERLRESTGKEVGRWASEEWIEWFEFLCSKSHLRALR